MTSWIVYLAAHLLIVLTSGLGTGNSPHDHINPTTLSNSLQASMLLTAPSIDFHNPLEHFSVATTSLDLVPEISLQVNTTLIPRSSPATWVEVTWKRVPFPNYDDFIALYPDGADVSAIAPIKFKLAARTTPSHVISGSGSTLFRVLNLRQPLKFALIRGGLQTPRVAAWSQSITPEEPNYPTQVHLSLPRSYASYSRGSGDSSWSSSKEPATSELAVQWTTRDKGTSPPTVQWSTSLLGDTTPPRDKNSDTLKIKNALSNNATGVSTTYARGDMCGPPANTTGWFDPGWFHYVIITGLDPGKKYYYRYGGSFEQQEQGNKNNSIIESGGDSTFFIWSEESSFIAPPAPFSTHPSLHHQRIKQKEQDTQRVKLLAIADVGQAEVDGSMEVSQMWASLQTHAALHWEVENNTPQLLIHNGDVSYARGYSTQWDSYWDLLGPAVRAVPYMTVPGNHERDWPGTGDGFGDASSRDSGGECGIAYTRRVNMPTSSDSLSTAARHFAGTTTFSKETPSPISAAALDRQNLPNTGTGTDDQPWYSFNFGPIHFLQFSTEHAFHPGSPQFTFIETDLAAVDRASTPWIVVGGHRPIYLDSISWSPLVPNTDQVVAAALRAALEDIFLKYKVDVTWTGHHHSYQRTCPLAKGQCIEDQKQVSPKQDSIVHLVIGNAGAGLSPNIHLSRPAIFEVVELRHGYLRVEANATHMRHEMVATDTGMVMDEFVLVK